MDSIDQSVDRSYESQSIPGPSKQSGYPLPGERVNPLEEVLSSEDAWEQRNILSLDGGGVRGIWSLMALEKLMEWIAIEEIEQSGSDTPVQHSFHPEPFPGHVSHGPFDKGGDGRHPEKASEYETWKESRKYLPCHYFDIIGGSSTGA
ncbi:MAG: hypothetical protein M1820_001591 [Bogoriella megaspora]|nr:MAG: hypothetical protein M1820_001591 [Bogoriella megaspora]